MHARISPDRSSVTWPLFASLALTALVVAFVCAPPMTPVHSWGKIFTLATAYLLVAGTVHALAVWGVCRVRQDADRDAVWRVIWTAWVAIVWLPLIALLTQENSPWVAVVLPVTALFAMKLMLDRRSTAQLEDDESAESRPAVLTATEMPLWRVPMGAVWASVALQLGAVLLAAQHAWTAGCLLSVAVTYPLGRWTERARTPGGMPEEMQEASPRWSRASAGNSMLVWMLLVLALVPFMATYAASLLGDVLGAKTHSAHASTAGAQAHAGFRGYGGIILVTPHKKNEVMVPVSMLGGGVAEKPNKIDFDGSYWYFNESRVQPGANARVAEGDPIHNHIFSTDGEPLMMEAHQRLKKPLSLSCCRSLRVDVLNAKNTPGSVVLEVLVGTTGLKGSGVQTLGLQVLPSSRVSPMPANRGVVEDSVTFQLSPLVKIRAVNEITVRIKTARAGAQNGAKVAIKDFALEP